MTTETGKNKLGEKKKENNLDFNSTKNQKEREMDDYKSF